MITLLASMVGFGSSFLPDLLGFFKNKQELQHKLNVMDKEADLLKLRSDLDLKELDVKADIEEFKALHSEPPSGTWVDGFRSAVRPVVTMVFFAFFVYLKYSQLQWTIASGAEGYLAIAAVWDTETSVLFSTIMGYWFGNRTREKVTRSMKG